MSSVHNPAAAAVADAVAGATATADEGSGGPAWGTRDDECCCICMDRPYQVIVQTCGHPFCRHCIYKCISRTMTSAPCPLCRAEIHGLVECGGGREVAIRRVQAGWSGNFALLSAMCFILAWHLLSPGRTCTCDTASLAEPPPPPPPGWLPI